MTYKYELQIKKEELEGVVKKSKNKNDPFYATGHYEEEIELISEQILRLKRGDLTCYKCNTTISPLGNIKEYDYLKENGICSQCLGNE